MRVTGRRNNGKTRPTAARRPDRYRFIKPGLMRHGFFDFNPKSYTCSQPVRRRGGGHQNKTRRRPIVGTLANSADVFFSDSRAFIVSREYRVRFRRQSLAIHDPIRVLSPIKKHAYRGNNSSLKPLLLISGQNRLTTVNVKSHPFANRNLVCCR